MSYRHAISTTTSPVRSELDGKAIAGGIHDNTNSSFLRKIGDWEYPINILTRDMAVDSRGNILVAGNNWSSSPTVGTVVKLKDSATIEGTIEMMGDMLLSGEIIKAGIAKSYTSTLKNALAANGRGNAESATNMLQAFIDKIQAQSGKGISESAAAKLIAAAQQILANLSVLNDKPSSL